MKIVADAHIPYLRGRLERYGEVIYCAGEEILPETVADADVLMTRTTTKVNARLLKNSPVKLVCSATIGFDHIDTEFCRQAGIAWTTAPGCNAGAVEQYIASALLALEQRGKFVFKGKTIGVVGVGNIGQKIVRIAELLGMKILQCDPPRAQSEGESLFYPLETLCEQADVITFHTPLTRGGKHATYHLANDVFFRALRRKPLIINSARGEIVDTEALKRAFSGGLIADCVMDCWENEPQPDAELLHRCAIATPHIAGYSAEGKANASRVMLEAFTSFFGLPPTEPIQLPEPENSIIDFSQIHSENRIGKLLLTTYNIEADSKLLKTHRTQFSELRKHYQFRRENSAYTVVGCTVDECKLLSQWGFRTK